MRIRLEVRDFLWALGRLRASRPVRFWRRRWAQIDSCPYYAGLALISLTILSGCQRNRGAYDPFIRADCLPAISLVDQDGHQIRVSSQPENLAGLARISRDLIAKAEVIDSAHRVVLDMDSNAPGKAWERRRG